MGGELKPLKSAPPPVSALISMASILLLCLYYLPGTIRSIYDEEATLETFTRRAYPNYVSVEGLITTRLFFGLVCWACTIYSVLCLSVRVNPPYIRPYSKLLDATITIEGRKHLYPLTSWSWMMLGTYFLSSACVTFQAAYRAQTSPPSKSLMVAVLIVWKIAAPITLLVGVVTKYVLWPEALKREGPTHILKHWLCLMQHNANVIMAASEVLFLGRMPVMGDTAEEYFVYGNGRLYKYFILTVIYGIAYVFFSWSTIMHWNPPESNLGPGCIYFFMDTTLGWIHTAILFGLMLTLFVFYGVFCFVEKLSNDYDGDEAGIYHHVAMMIALVLLTCRWRD